MQINPYQYKRETSPHWSFDPEEERKVRRHNARVEARLKAAFADALAFTLFQVAEGHKPSDEEKAEISPRYERKARKIAKARAVIVLDLSFLDESEG